MLPRIGFIGIGNMGSGMAANLLKRSYPLSIYDKFESSRFKELVDTGASRRASIVELTDHSDVLISMVPSTEHVQDLYLNDKRGILSILSSQKRSNTLLIDCSTIDPVASVKVGDACRAAGQRFVDAPVSGGVTGAIAGSLTFMVGSKSADFTETAGILSSMGRPIDCGGPGKGAAVKVCNNLILGVTMLGVAEGYRLADHLGVDLNVFNSIVNASSGQCWSSEKYNPVPGLKAGVPAERGYQGGFAIDLMIKDLGLAQSAANGTANIAEFAKTEYSKIKDKGKGHLDFGCVFEFMDSVSKK